MTLNIKFTQHNDTQNKRNSHLWHSAYLHSKWQNQHNETQQIDYIATLAIIFVLSRVLHHVLCHADCQYADCCSADLCNAECCYAECCYAECCSAEWCYAECCYAECCYAECYLCWVLLCWVLWRHYNAMKRSLICFYFLLYSPSQIRVKGLGKEPYWRGRLSTVDLLVLTSLDRHIFILKILIVFLS